MPTSNNYILSGGGSFVSRPIRSSVPFTGVHVSLDQREPYQIMRDPSFTTGAAGWVRAPLSGSDSSVSLDAVNFGARGSVLSVDGDGSGTSRGAESPATVMRTGGVARASVDLYLSETVSSGDWHLSVLDGAGAPIARAGISPTPRKWETHAFEFIAQPSSGWLYSEDGSSEYDFRRRIDFPVSSSTVPAGTAILIDDVKRGILTATSDERDFAITYYDGATLRRIPFDYTDEGELWFATQRDIPAGRTPDGSVDDVTNESLGMYHIYYYNAGENAQPDMDIDTLFHSLEADMTAPSIGGEAIFDGTGTLSYTERDAIPYGDGHLMLSYTPASDISDYSEGERRYLVDMSPSGDEYRTEVYFYEQRLYVILTHKTGFRSGAVFSTELPVSPSGTHQMTAGTKYRMLIEWGAPGSKEYADTEARVIIASCAKDGDPTIGGAMTLIENQYDQITYDNGEF